MAKTKFGILQPTGKVTQAMNIDISKIKSPDPLAFAYGMFQARSGQKISKDRGLAPEYVRGYKIGKKQKGL